MSTSEKEKNKYRLKGRSDFSNISKNIKAQVLKSDLGSQFDKHDGASSDCGEEDDPHTYEGWRANELKIVGHTFEYIDNALLLSIAEKEVNRIAAIPQGHADEHQKNHVHAYIMDVLRAECTKTDVLSQRIAKQQQNKSHWSWRASRAATARTSKTMWTS
jgi:hypothetical protein